MQPSLVLLATWPRAVPCLAGQGGVLACGSLLAKSICRRNCCPALLLWLAKSLCLGMLACWQICTAKAMVWRTHLLLPTLAGQADLQCSGNRTCSAMLGTVHLQVRQGCSALEHAPAGQGSPIMLWRLRPQVGAD